MQAVEQPEYLDGLIYKINNCWFTKIKILHSSLWINSSGQANDSVSIGTLIANQSHSSIHVCVLDTDTHTQIQLGLLANVGDVDPEANAFTRYPLCLYPLCLSPPLSLRDYRMPCIFLLTILTLFFSTFIFFLQKSFILNWNIPSSAFACVWLWPPLVLNRDWCRRTGTHATGVG